ncbi:MAG TPA: Hsp20/alpha crystallin family protein [Smithellaceae bacterium]|nr:Hsp20/alpha crystallin family protein [Smithellaceae bacterium]
MFNPSLWRFRRYSNAMPELLNLQREMNRLFSSVGQKSPEDYPAINILEKDGAAVVTAELPGIDPEKIDVSVSGEILTIAGSTLQETFAQGETYLRQERGLGNFKRNIQLPFQVNSQAVEARYEKGILMITLPRIKENLPKKIKIK